MHSWSFAETLFEVGRGNGILDTGNPLLSRIDQWVALS